ncbi:hypothetical protein [Sporosarcina luteola]|uniref:hypothetical protein n=1 Tax=Sporosarcina luteola TaxID=582850 RepID=UPI00204148B7|nr:hypothetical protein [Sporosarcina luteola]MCM3711122.1 hypothetical protein [Sporosarcina luteola]
MKYKEIFELKSIGLNNSQIGRRLGISRNTVRKYLGMSPEEFEAWLHSLETREKKLDPHKDRILHWLKEYPDTSSAQILDWLEEKLGVTNVSEGTVRNYVNELREIYHIPKTANYRVYTAVEEFRRVCNAKWTLERQYS